MKSALNKTNLAYLGALDAFYDAYDQMQDLFFNERKRMIATKDGKFVNAFSVENNVKKLFRVIIDDLFLNYSYVFVDPPQMLYTSAWAIDMFSLLEEDKIAFYKNKEVTLKIVSFQKFLDEIHNMISRIQFRRKQRKNYKCDFDDVCNEVNNHIWSEVEKSISHIRIKNDGKAIVTDKPLFVFEVLSSTLCYKKKHEVSPSPFYALKTDDSGMIALPTHYCKNCDKYLIGKITLNLFDEKFGKVLVEKYEAQLENGSFSSFQIESKLHQLGYNVVDGKLSDIERKNLLISILNQNKMTYFDICRIIEQNIRLFNGIPKYALAVNKWETDLKIIGEYIIKHNGAEHDPNVDNTH